MNPGAPCCSTRLTLRRAFRGRKRRKPQNLPSSRSSLLACPRVRSAENIHHSSGHSKPFVLRSQCAPTKAMGLSDPEVRKRLTEARWQKYIHQVEKLSWPWWKRLLHRLRRCPICELKT